MKVVNFIKNLVLGVIVIVFFAFVIFNTILMLNINGHGVTEFANSTVVIMRNQSATEKYKKNDIIVIGHKNISNIEVGDEIFVYKVQKTGASLIEYGKVGAVRLENEQISFENGATYSDKLIIGEVDKVYPRIGRYLSLVQSTWGFLFIILVPSFLIFIYELYAIIVEIRYGNKNETQKID